MNLWELSSAVLNWSHLALSQKIVDLEEAIASISILEDSREKQSISKDTLPHDETQLFQKEEFLSIEQLV